MKKILAGISSIATYLLLTPSAFAAAGDTPINACPTGSYAGLCFSAKDLGAVIGSSLNFIFVLAGIIALGYLIWGGIKWVISEGDKTNVESARNHIVASIIGLIIIFMSYLVMNIVLNFFAGVNLTNLNLPQLCVTKTGDGKSCCPSDDITPAPATGSNPKATCGIPSLP